MTDEIDQSTLDLLMQTDPIELTKSDIDSIIAYQRQHRAKMTESVSKARTKSPKLTDGPSVKLDLGKLGLVKAPTPGLKPMRRI